MIAKHNREELFQPQIKLPSATIALVPQANLGIVVLNNTDEYAGFRFNLSAQYRLIEMLYDLPPRITDLWGFPSS